MKRSRGIYIEFETSGPPSRAPGIRDLIAGVFGVIGASLHEALRLAAASQGDATGGASRRRGATRVAAGQASPRSAPRRARATQRRLPADVERALSVLALPAGRVPSPEHLRRARNAAILTAHPDRGGSNAAAARVIEAYRIVAGAIPQS